MNGTCLQAGMGKPAKNQQGTSKGTSKGVGSRFHGQEDRFRYAIGMPRRIRATAGGFVYHVLNRGVGRMRLFRKAADFAAMEQVLEEAVQRTRTRLLSYCLMSNHWQLLWWPREDGELSEVTRWLTVTHTQRWHANQSGGKAAIVGLDTIAERIRIREATAKPACRASRR
jgi:REP element-mobilizing transposase RayT